MQAKFVKTARKHITVTNEVKTMSFSSKSSAAKFGAYGEVLAIAHLELLGLKVDYTGQSSVGYDLLVENTLRVEIKTAKRSKDGIWQFNLTKLNHSDITKSDVVLLQCVIELGHVITYAIPTSAIATLKQIKITNHPTLYTGKYAQWKV